MKAKLYVRKISIIACAVTLVVSAALYCFKNPYWYYPAAYGIWLLFDNLSASKGNKTTMDVLIEKKYTKFLALYILLFATGFLIELFGRNLFHFWVYPLVPFAVMNTIGLVGYPFLLMSFREMYQFLKSIFKNVSAAVLFSMIFGIVIWEVPNLYSKDWIYNIPFVKVDLAGINLIVVAGWIILIAAPLLVYWFVDRTYK